MNVRLIIILLALVAVIGSALGVVHNRHESRRQAVQLGLLEDVRDAYIAEWSRLQLEQAYLADAGHVESKARERLGMQAPAETLILVVEPLVVEHRVVEHRVVEHRVVEHRGAQP